MAEGHGPEGSHTIVDPHGSPFPLDPRSEVQFMLAAPNRWISAQRREEDGRVWLDLHAMTGAKGRLLTRPWAANALHVSIED